MSDYIENMRASDKQPVRYTIEPVDAYREFVNGLIAESWSGPFIVSKGVLHDTRSHKGFVSVKESDVMGCILYSIVGSGCEITVLESLSERQGIGRSLIHAVVQVAKEAGCDRVWLVTTNDNTQAIRFYQRFGFSLCAVHIDSMKEARKLKPQIPLTGNEDIPLAHEFEFEMRI